jgi:hypothetical protein
VKILKSHPGRRRQTLADRIILVVQVCLMTALKMDSAQSIGGVMTARPNGRIGIPGASFTDVTGMFVERAIVRYFGKPGLSSMMLVLYGPYHNQSFSLSTRSPVLCHELRCSQSCVAVFYIRDADTRSSRQSFGGPPLVA